MDGSNEFVWKQLKMCECKEYFDLFKDFDEDRFRKLNIAALNKLAIGDEAKDRIYEHVCRLKFQQRSNSTGQASFAMHGPVPIIKEESSGTQYDITDDDDIEITFCSTTQANQRPEELATTNLVNVKSEDCSTSTVPNSSSDLNPCQAPTFTGTHLPIGENEIPGSSAIQNHSVIVLEEASVTSPSVTSPETSDSRKSRELFWVNFAQTVKSVIVGDVATTSRAATYMWNPQAHCNILELNDLEEMTHLEIISSSLKEEIGISDFIPLMTTEQRDLFISHYKNDGLVEFSELLRFIFLLASRLQELALYFKTTQELDKILDTLAGIPCDYFTYVELAQKWQWEDAVITQLQLTKLFNIFEKYSSLTELKIESIIQIDSLEDKSFDFLLLHLADKLQHFEIGKNFIGRNLVSNTKGGIFEIQVPVMSQIRNIIIAPYYEISVPDVCPNIEQVIELDNDSSDSEASNTSGDFVPIPVLLKFQDGKYEKLVKVNLGSLIEIDVKLINFPALEEFNVGSPWNIRDNIFDNNNSGTSSNGWINERLEEIQFPDALTDPTIFQRARSTFPSITGVKLQLPTVECLKEFFNAFAKSRVKNLTITFDYVFEAGLISALTGNPFIITSLFDYAKLQKLKKCLQWEDFAKMNNIEIPEEDFTGLLAASDPDPGIRNLRFLNYLELNYISRKFYYPKLSAEEVGQEKHQKRELLSDDLFPKGKEFFDAFSNNRCLLKSRALYTTGFFVRDVEAHQTFIFEHGWHLPLPGTKRAKVNTQQVVIVKQEQQAQAHLDEGQQDCNNDNSNNLQENSNDNDSSSDNPTPQNNSTAKKAKTYSNRISPAFLYSRVTRIKKEKRY